MSLLSTDPISDMLTRIRNANMVNIKSISLPYSKNNFAIAKVLKDNNFILEVKDHTDKDTKHRLLELTLALPDANPIITEIVRISKPGRRVYTSFKDIPKIKNGRGIVVISTTKGMVSGDTAVTNKLGGELICSVY